MGEILLPNIQILSYVRNLVLWLIPSALNMEAAGSSEMLVTRHETKRACNSDDTVVIVRVV
jgi:hypothetical protein